MNSSRAPGKPSESEIATFRSFNRRYTRFLGVLDEQLLGSGYSLAEARILYELAHLDGPTATSLIESLGLDAGYLSRILSSFHRKGLITRRTSKTDARSATLLLTAKGKTAFNKLNALSTRQATNVLEAMQLSDRARLLGAMSDIHTVLEPKPASPSFTLRPHRLGDMGEVVRLEAIGYAQQFHWDNSFEALVAKIVSEFLSTFNPAREHCWIAEIDGRHVGHIFLVQHPERPDTAKLRLLYVDPPARGLGLGQSLVQHCLDLARGAGYSQVVLWTQSILTAAHRIYSAAGFRLVSEAPHHSFGHDLIGQEWQLDLH